jgi:hypothetical protein
LRPIILEKMLDDFGALLTSNLHSIVRASRVNDEDLAIQSFEAPEASRQVAVLVKC